MTPMSAPSTGWESEPDDGAAHDERTARAALPGQRGVDHRCRHAAGVGPGRDAAPSGICEPLPVGRAHRAVGAHPLRGVGAHRCLRCLLVPQLCGPANASSPPPIRYATPCRPSASWPAPPWCPPRSTPCPHAPARPTRRCRLCLREGHRRHPVRSPCWSWATTATLPRSSPTTPAMRCSRPPPAGCGGGRCAHGSPRAVTPTLPAINRSRQVWMLALRSDLQAGTRWPGVARRVPLPCQPGPRGRLDTVVRRSGRRREPSRFRCDL